jgi:ribosomal protein S18 acetylase RimI-like enzyme
VPKLAYDEPGARERRGNEDGPRHTAESPRSGRCDEKRRSCGRTLRARTARPPPGPTSPAFQRPPRSRRAFGATALPIIEVRDAELSDARRIAEIWRKAHATRLHGRFDAPANLHQRIEERMRSRDASYVVATDAQRIVGIGSHLPARENEGVGPVIPGLMHVSMIAVDPEHWRNGIGKALTRYCVARATKLGYASIQLWTHVSNQRAQRLYASVGFREVGREQIDERGERIRLYTLHLGSSAVEAQVPETP